MNSPHRKLIKSLVISVEAVSFEKTCSFQLFRHFPTKIQIKSIARALFPARVLDVDFWCDGVSVVFDADVLLLLSE